MTDGDSYRKLATLAQRWRDLAERRRAYYTDLYESGRWKRYFSEEQLLERMREVVASAEAWRLVVTSFRPAAPAADTVHTPEDPARRAA